MAGRAVGKEQTIILFWAHSQHLSFSRFGVHLRIPVNNVPGAFGAPGMDYPTIYYSDYTTESSQLAELLKI